MFWPINRQFLLHVSVEVLAVLLRPRIGIQMDRVAGLLNLLASFWICSRMLKAMQRFVYVGERLGCGFTFHFSHSSESST